MKLSDAQIEEKSPLNLEKLKKTITFADDSSIQTEPKE